MIFSLNTFCQKLKIKIISWALNLNFYLFCLFILCVFILKWKLQQGAPGVHKKSMAMVETLRPKLQVINNNFA